MLTLDDGAFKGSDEGLVALIARRAGHALSAKPQTEKKGAGTVAAGAAWKAAVTADGGKALTDYGKKDPEEAYADAYSMFLTAARDDEGAAAEAVRVLHQEPERPAGP